MRGLIVCPATLLAGLGLHASALAQGVLEGERLIIPPEFAIGWLDDPSGSDWTLQREASTSTANWQRSGWWLEARTGFRLRPKSDLLISGGWFFSQPASGVWHANRGMSQVAFDVHSYRWGTMDALFRYHARQERFDVLSGLRWDKKKTTVHYSDHTDDDYSLNTYAPILGFQLNQPAAGGVLSVRVLGSPFVCGQMKYKYRIHTGGYEEYGNFPLKNGYTIECRAQYTHAVGSRMKLGGFAQWGTQHVQSREVALSGMTRELVSWSVTNHAWTLGVTASLGFGSPF